MGVGAVGSATAFSLVASGVVSELTLVDVDGAKAEGEAMDLNHGAYFTPPVDVSVSDPEDCRDADVVVVTAGANQRPGESRLDLLGRNVELFEDLIPRLTDGLDDDDAVLLVVTNPVDALARVAQRLSGLPPERVLGSGTVLDTSRFRHVLSRECDVDPKNVHGYVGGEHGDSEVFLWSSTNVAGVPFDEFAANHGVDANRGEIAAEVREAAYEIIERKGATNHAIALAVTEMVETVVRDERSILTVSTRLDGEYGIEGAYASVPCIADRGGAREVVERDLPPDEREALHESARVLRESFERTGIE